MGLREIRNSEVESLRKVASETGDEAARARAGAEIARVSRVRDPERSATLAKPLMRTLSG